MIWGFVRLTDKPRYLLMLHCGKKKSHTVTALVSTVSHLPNYCLETYAKETRICVCTVKCVASSVIVRKV